MIETTSAAGDYDPALTETLNIDPGTLECREAQAVREGSIVFVSLDLAMDVTAEGNVVFSVEPPFPVSATTNWRAILPGMFQRGGALLGVAFADLDFNEGEFRAVFKAPVEGTYTVRLSGSYRL